MKSVLIETFRTTFYRILRFLVYRFFRLYYGLNVIGRHNLPSDTGYILAVNHQSFLDPFIIGCPVPDFVCFMARDTLWNSRVFRMVGPLLNNVMPVKRGQSDRKALKKACERLKRGWVVLLFPEGTRTPDGSLGRIKKGPAFISKMSNMPIVPAIIDGAFDIWPKNKKLPSLLGRPVNTLTVRFGEPIWPDDYKTLTGRERLEKTTRMLNFRMHELFDNE